MSMQPINHSEINERFDRMGANWMHYMHTMQDGLLAQMRVDKSDLQKEIANVHEEVIALGEEVTTLGEVVAALDTKVAALDTKVAALDTKVTTLGEEATAFRAETRMRLNAIERRQEALEHGQLELTGAVQQMRASMEAFGHDMERIVAEGIAHVIEVFNERLMNIERRLPPEAPQA